MVKQSTDNLEGIWQSRYEYTSSSREGIFEGKHKVRIVQKDPSHVVVESLPEGNDSYVVIRLTIDGAIATGSWQEHTNEKGYYKGAIYYGTIQLIIDPDGRTMRGKWLGFDKESNINVGPWELTRPQ